ncbi:MAG TPA: ParB/RepB/Spo0J family partition protein [Blastocatellia bacterium]|nr:ParB/RepB/Spo0J family partition protein [Blastocatellia bacterium]
MSKRGLPDNFRLRHDSHYVELLTSSAGGAPVGRMIPIDKLAPNPGQPRVEFGDLTELIASIKEKGVLEPLLVRPSDVGGRFMIISGERRYRASLELGLAELPCIEMDVDDRGVAEIALIENLQRKDLTPFEEADGLRALGTRFGYTHEEIATKVGKSRTSITEAFSISSIPLDVRETCRRADISSKALLLQIARQPTDEEMRQYVEQITKPGAARDEARRSRKSEPRTAGDYVFKHKPATGEWALTLHFTKAEASSDEIKEALLSTIDELGL